MRVARYDIMDDKTVIVNLGENALRIIAQYADMPLEELTDKLEKGMAIPTPYSIYEKIDDSADQSE